MVGSTVGSVVGAVVGSMEGTKEGDMVGSTVGSMVSTDSSSTDRVFACDRSYKMNMIKHCRNNIQAGFSFISNLDKDRQRSEINKL